jgi:hypothetical protein
MIWTITASTSGYSSSGSGRLCRASAAQAGDEATGRHRSRRGGHVPPHPGQVAAGDDRVRRQAVDLGLVEQEERAAAADAVVRVVQVQPGTRFAGLLQLTDALPGPLAQCLQTLLAISQREPSAWNSPATGTPGPEPPSVPAPAMSPPACQSPPGPSPGRLTCSMNATWRQAEAPRPPVLSYDIPVRVNPSSGTSFHSLQATSQALQPMHTEVSVKNPIRGGCSA